MTQHEPNTQGASWKLNWKALVQHKLEAAGFPPKMQAEIIITLETLIDALLSRERAEGERRGAEKERERIFSDMTKYQFRYEITAEEIKTLHENLTHLDESLRSDGFYEIADRIYNDKMYRMGAPKSKNLVKEYTVYVYKPHKNEATLPTDSTEKKHCERCAYKCSKGYPGSCSCHATDSTEGKCCGKCYTSDYVEGQVVAIGCLNPYCTCHPNTQDSTEEITNKD